MTNATSIKSNYGTSGMASSEEVCVEIPANNQHSVGVLSLDSKCCTVTKCCAATMCCATVLCVCAVAVVALPAYLIHSDFIHSPERYKKACTDRSGYLTPPVECAIQASIVVTAITLGTPALFLGLGVVAVCGLGLACGGKRS